MLLIPTKNMYILDAALPSLNFANYRYYEKLFPIIKLCILNILLGYVKEMGIFILLIPIHHKNKQKQYKNVWTNKKILFFFIFCYLFLFCFVFFCCILFEKITEAKYQSWWWSLLYQCGTAFASTHCDLEILEQPSSVAGPTALSKWEK